MTAVFVPSKLTDFRDYSRRSLLAAPPTLLRNDCYLWRHFATNGNRPNETHVHVPFDPERFATYVFKDGGVNSVQNLMRVYESQTVENLSHKSTSVTKTGTWTDDNAAFIAGATSGQVFGGTISRSSTRNDTIACANLFGHTLYVRGLYYSNAGLALVAVDGSYTAATRLTAVVAGDIKTVTGAVNNGSGLVRLTVASHGFTTSEKILVESVGGVSAANGTWVVTVIDSNTIDLQGTTFSGTYTSGGNAGYFSNSDIGKRYIDFYSNQNIVDDATCVVEGLEEKPHTLTLQVVGTYRGGSTDSRIYVSNFCSSRSGITPVTVIHTTASGAAASNTITPASVAGFAVNDIILLVNASGQAEMRTLSAVGGSTINCFGSLVYTHTDSALYKMSSSIVTNRRITDFLNLSNWSAFGPVWEYAPTADSSNYLYLSDTHTLEAGTSNLLYLDDVLKDNYVSTRLSPGVYVSGKRARLERISVLAHPGNQLAKTTASIQSALSQPILSVASTTGFSNGDTIIVSFCGGSKQELHTISSVGSGQFTLVSNLTNTQLVGAHVIKAGVSTSSGNTAGGTSLTLSSATGFSAGEQIIVGAPGATTTELHVIKSIATNTLTLFSALANNQNSVVVYKATGRKRQNYLLDTDTATNLRTAFQVDWFKAGAIRVGYPAMLPIGNVKYRGGSYENTEFPSCNIGDIVTSLPQSPDDNTFYAKRKTDLAYCYSSAHDTVYALSTPRTDINVNNWALSANQNVAVQTRSDGLDKIYVTRSYTGANETVTAGDIHLGEWGIRLFRLKSAATALA